MPQQSFLAMCSLLRRFLRRAVSYQRIEIWELVGAGKQECSGEWDLECVFLAQHARHDIEQVCTRNVIWILLDEMDVRRESVHAAECDSGERGQHHPGHGIHRAEPDVMYE